MTIENTILTRVNDSNNYNKQLENLKSKLKVKCKREAEQTRTYKILQVPWKEHILLTGQTRRALFVFGGKNRKICRQSGDQLWSKYKF